MSQQAGYDWFFTLSDGNDSQVTAYYKCKFCCDESILPLKINVKIIDTEQYDFISCLKIRLFQFQIIQVQFEILV